MSDPQAKQTPIFELLRQCAELSISDGALETGKLLADAADRLRAFEVAARRITNAVSAGGITSHDAPSDAALAALRDLAG